MSEAAVAMMNSGTRTKHKSERLSNWVGFLFFLFFTATFFLRSSRLSIFLLLPVLHEAITACAFLLRRAPKAKIKVLPARVAAYGATFSIPVFALVQGLWFPNWLMTTSHSWQRGVGGIAWLLGTLLAIAALWQLRYSFSIEPQARKFQGTGLYRLARHPIYLGYLLEYLGILIISPTVQLAAVVLVWAALCRLRVHYEEKVLRSTFPEYQAYAREVGMLWPRFRPACAPAPRHPMPLQNAIPEVIER